MRGVQWVPLAAVLGESRKKAFLLFSFLLILSPTPIAKMGKKSFSSMASCPPEVSRGRAAEEPARSRELCPFPFSDHRCVTFPGSRCKTVKKEKWKTGERRRCCRFKTAVGEPLGAAPRMSRNDDFYRRWREKEELSCVLEPFPRSNVLFAFAVSGVVFRDNWASSQRHKWPVGDSSEASSQTGVETTGVHVGPVDT